jgi:coenzyme F420 hydrogenase subunit beta
MESEKELFLEPLKESYALSMHGHMLDFKKRGTFIRLNWKKAFGQPTPEFGYYPENLTFGRIFIERIIAVFLWIGKQDWAHFLIEKLPLWLIGPLFNVLRKNWKRASKPTKRRGLTNQKFILKECTNRWKEIIFQSKSS